MRDDVNHLARTFENLFVMTQTFQVLNRSMDPKTYEQNAPKPPLIAQIPPAISQMPMLPQHVITSGTEKNCIRLRGLPYEAKVEHILHFLEDFAKHIVYQGVHLVYNAQVSRHRRPMVIKILKVASIFRVSSMAKLSFKWTQNRPLKRRRSKSTTST